MPSKKDVPNRSVATRFKKGTSGNPKGMAPMVLNRSLLPTIKQLAARGVREVDIARACDIHPTTWQRIKNEDAQVAEAFAAGRQKMHDSLVNVLYQNAMKGQLVPALFLLKCVFHYREDSPAETPSIVINLPSAIPATNYRPAVVERVDE